MKKPLLLTLAATFIIPVFAEQRTLEDIINIAKGHYSINKKVNSRNSTIITQKNDIITSGDIFRNSNNAINNRKSTSVNDTIESDINYSVPESAFYFVNYSGEGFVLISGDDNMTPILGYSETGHIAADSIPENFKDMLKSYAVVYETARLYGINGTEIDLETETNNAANTFHDYVTPLLNNIAWNQRTPYNKYCPVFDGITSVTGCGSTAVSQVMLYYKYPEKGQDSVKYRFKSDGKYSGDFEVFGDSVEIKADLSEYIINWEDMLPTYTDNNYTVEQANAAAKLLTNVGYTLHTTYGKNDSETYFHYIMNLKKVFNYDDDMEILPNDIYSYKEWIGIIKNEISAQRPVLTAGFNYGNGHLYVMDGYDKDDYIHINWGWNGNYNGYFYIYNQNPYIEDKNTFFSEGRNYNLLQYILINLKPSDNKKTSVANRLFCLSTGIGSNIISLKQQDEITVPLYNLFHTKENCETNLHILLYKDGNVCDTLISDTIPETDGNNNSITYTINKKIDHHIASGNYKLRFAYENDGYSDTIIFSKAYQRTYYLTATEDSIFLSTDKKSMNVKITKADYGFQNNYLYLKLNIANYSEYPKQLPIIISLESVKRDCPNTSVAATTIPLFNSKFYLTEKDTSEMSITSYLEDSIVHENYYLSVKYLDYDMAYKELLLNTDTVVIKTEEQANRNYDLIVRKPVFDTTLTKNKGDSIYTCFTIINKGDFFVGYLNLLFTDPMAGPDSALSYGLNSEMKTGNEVILFNNDSVEIEYRYPIMNMSNRYDNYYTVLPSGNYRMNLCYYVRLNGYNNYPSYIGNVSPEGYTSTLLQIENPSGIKNTVTTCDMEYSFRNSILKISSDEILRRITIHNILGYEVLDKEIDSRNLSLTLNRGQFIIRITTDSGKTRTFKVYN